MYPKAIYVALNHFTPDSSLYMFRIPQTDLLKHMVSFIDQTAKGYEEFGIHFSHKHENHKNQRICTVIIYGDSVCLYILAHTRY